MRRRAKPRSLADVEHVLGVRRARLPVQARDSGLVVGPGEGDFEGDFEGDRVGPVVGDADGEYDGLDVGASVPSHAVALPLKSPLHGGNTIVGPTAAAPPKSLLSDRTVLNVSVSVSKTPTALWL